jgi:DNA polymerase-3 subunit epsilon
LLAEVYLELIGGREPGLALAADQAKTQAAAAAAMAVSRQPRPARPHSASEEELAAHAAFLGKIKNAIWGQ